MCCCCFVFAQISPCNVLCSRKSFASALWNLFIMFDLVLCECLSCYLCFVSFNLCLHDRRRPTVVEDESTVKLPYLIDSRPKLTNSNRLNLLEIWIIWDFSFDSTAISFSSENWDSLHLKCHQNCLFSIILLPTVAICKAFQSRHLRYASSLHLYQVKIKRSFTSHR